MTRMVRPVVLITGAARRLGRVLACDFGRRGWAVGLHVHRHEADAETLVCEIEALGGTAHIFAADLNDFGAIERLVPDVTAALGAPACLINNASTFVYDDVTSLTSEQWDRQFAVNLKAPVFLAKALAAGLPGSESGVVINILDQRVWRPTPRFLSYSGSKAALWSMTQMLAQGLAPQVRVNAIGPGPMLQSVYQTAEDFRAEFLTTPLRRPTSPDEVAAAVRFILDAPSMTGQMIALDGGQHLAWETSDIGDGRG